VSVDDLDGQAGVVLGLIDRLDAARGRLVVGIAGPPASGKSTLAARVVERLLARDGQGTAALVPMDGFHLENDMLDARGLRAVKGAPETFDAEGFAALLRDIREADGDVSYPLFDRAADRTRPGAGLLRRETRVVVVEGNYLLLRSGPWAGLGPLFDATVMITAPVEVLEARLVNRWLAHGLHRAGAAARAQSNDLANARRVIAESATSDLTLTTTDRSRGAPPATPQEERPT